MDGIPRAPGVATVAIAAPPANVVGTLSIAEAVLAAAAVADVNNNSSAIRFFITSYAIAALC